MNKPAKKELLPVEYKIISKVARVMSYKISELEEEDLLQELYCFVLSEDYLPPKTNSITTPEQHQQRKRRNVWHSWLALREQNNHPQWNPLQEQMLKREAIIIIESLLLEDFTLRTQHITTRQLFNFILSLEKELPSIFPKLRPSTLQTLVAVLKGEYPKYLPAFKEYSQEGESYTGFSKQKQQIFKHCKYMLSYELPELEYTNFNN